MVRRFLLCAALFAVAAGCRKEPLIKVEGGNSCVKTLTGDVSVPKDQAADILIVVDNSGSMQEEQLNLAANFLNENPAECPLQNLADIPAEFKNPPPALYTGTGPLAKCGFIQLVAAFDNDFHVGVITTDMSVCDNRAPSAQAAACKANGTCVNGGAACDAATPCANTWGFRPQRGCLHPDGAPGDANLHKVIARNDLLDDDTTNNNLAARFRATLDNIGTFGSPIERGLDAMDTFLDPAADKNPDCAGDLDEFRRPDASLVVIFLSDEEDCSHNLGGALDVFGNENVKDTCSEVNPPFGSVSPARCYSDKPDLSSVNLYVDSLLGHDPRAKVAVIAGAIGADDTPSGCLVGPTGTPIGGANICFESGGFSNFTAPGEPCGPEATVAHGGLPCCVADGGSRYYAFADLVAQHATDSICNSSFRGTMLEIAAFIAAVDAVQLAEPPDSPAAILVELTHADGTVTVIPQLAATADCTAETGYQLEGTDRIVLCGDARPGPGDNLKVRARGGAADVACNQPFFEASGGAVNCAQAGDAPLLAGGAALLGLALRRVRRR